MKLLILISPTLPENEIRLCTKIIYTKIWFQETVHETKVMLISHLRKSFKSTSKSEQQTTN